MTGRRASRPAGPVTPGTDQLRGSWVAHVEAPSAAPGDAQASDREARRSDPEARQSDREARQSDPEHATGPARPRRRRRVTTAPAAGYDPVPEPEPDRHGAGENDARLLGDRPPHWG